MNLGMVNRIEEVQLAALLENDAKNAFLSALRARREEENGAENFEAFIESKDAISWVHLEAALLMDLSQAYEAWLSFDELGEVNSFLQSYPAKSSGAGTKFEVRDYVAEFIGLATMIIDGNHTAAEGGVVSERYLQLRQREENELGVPELTAVEISRIRSWF